MASLLAVVISAILSYGDRHASYQFDFTDFATTSSLLTQELSNTEPFILGEAEVYCEIEILEEYYCGVTFVSAAYANHVIKELVNIWEHAYALEEVATYRLELYVELGSPNLAPAPPEKDVQTIVVRARGTNKLFNFINYPLTLTIEGEVFPASLFIAYTGTDEH